MNIKSFFIVCLSILFFTCDTPKKYNVIGVIKEIDKDKNKLLIDHDEIPGFMVKMVMFFNLHTSVDINQFSVNDSVKFDLIIKDKNSYSLNYDIIGKTKISTKEDFWEDDEDLKYSLKEAGDSIDNATFLDVNNKEISLSAIL